MRKCKVNVNTYLKGKRESETDRTNVFFTEKNSTETSLWLTK